MRDAPTHNHDSGARCKPGCAAARRNRAVMLSGRGRERRSVPECRGWNARSGVLAALARLSAGASVGVRLLGLRGRRSSCASLLEVGKLEIWRSSSFSCFLKNSSQKKKCQGRREGAFTYRNRPPAARTHWHMAGSSKRAEGWSTWSNGVCSRFAWPGSTTRCRTAAPSFRRGSRGSP